MNAEALRREAAQLIAPHVPTVQQAAAQGGVVHLKLEIGEVKFGSSVLTRCARHNPYNLADPVAVQNVANACVAKLVDLLASALEHNGNNAHDLTVESVV